MLHFGVSEPFMRDAISDEQRTNSHVVANPMATGVRASMLDHLQRFVQFIGQLLSVRGAFRVDAIDAVSERFSFPMSSAGLLESYNAGNAAHDAQTQQKNRDSKNRLDRTTGSYITS